MARKIFVNLAVRDLKRSKEFFSKLGFEFNPQFTDDKAACMVLSEEGFVMLLGEQFFRTLPRSPSAIPPPTTKRCWHSPARVAPRWMHW